MGFRWKLEISRMIGYVFLPVTTFYIYNQVCIMLQWPWIHLVLKLQMYLDNVDGVAFLLMIISCLGGLCGFFQRRYYEVWANVEHSRINWKREEVKRSAWIDAEIARSWSQKTIWRAIQIIFHLNSSISRRHNQKWHQYFNLCLCIAFAFLPHPQLLTMPATTFF